MNDGREKHRVQIWTDHEMISGVIAGMLIGFAIGVALFKG